MRAAALLLLLAVLAAPTVADAQMSTNIPRVGMSLGGSALNPYLDAFRHGLREAGYVEGRTITLEVRYIEGKFETLPAIMQEFVRLNVNVIVAGGGLPAARAARAATSTIPIVSPAIADPVGAGVVANLGRPGGNFTGLSLQSTEITGKRLELLKAALPQVKRVAILHHVGTDTEQPTAATAAARVLGLQSQVIEIADPAAFDAAFAEIGRQRADAIVMLAASFFNTHRRALIDRMATGRIPAMWDLSDFAEAGALMSYGPALSDMYRRAAIYVDKILKGAKAGDLPIEQPTKFELVINLKTAKALGITIPPPVLQRADRVIP